MTVSLAGQPWLTAAPTRAVIAALEAAGGPGCVRFVGGCVRNALIGQAIDDVDLATRLRPEAVLAALQAAGLKAVPTGLAHGTVTAVSGRRPFEITTLRRDVDTDGRRAVVAFTDDWAEDAARRDFRLNALYADADGAVLDPTGAGIADAREGRIVFVGDPGQRIREDYLRILRFFRFHAWYGRGAPDPAGLAACAALAEGVERLSAERVSKEMLKLLAAPDPGPALQAMADAGVLARLLPERGTGGLDLALAMIPVSPDPVLRLSALLPDDPAVVEAAARRLRLSNPVRARLTAAVAGAARLDLTAPAARAQIYRAGAAAFADRVARAEAAAGRPGAGRPLTELAQAWRPPRLPVGGREAAAAGCAVGPETGRVLKAYEESWIADDFPVEGEAARLRRLAAARAAGSGSGG